MYFSTNSMLILVIWFAFKTTLSQAQQAQSYFISDEYGEGQGLTYECIDDIDCILNCYATNACGSSTTIGPANAKLTINCNSHFDSQTSTQSSCQTLTVYAQNSTELEINVYNENYEFQRNNIYTPISDLPSTVNTFITCGIIGVNNDKTTKIWSCAENHIYSVNGWRSVEWTYYEDTLSSLTNIMPERPNTMHCGTDYLQSCSNWTVDSFYYRCTDQTSECDFNRANQTRAPVPAPTQSPTTPSEAPTKSPSAFPSKPPTKSPSTLPTKSPSTFPTQSPVSFTDCVSNVILLDGIGMVSLSLAMDEVSEKMRITLNGPNTNWFGIGFGVNSMVNVYAIVVSEDSASTTTVHRRLLEDHNAGTAIVGHAFSTVTSAAIGDTRIVSIIDDWKSSTNANIYDFTPFFNGSLCKLPIIAARGVNLDFAYHGQYKNQMTLSSCNCEIDDTEMPTKAPSDIEVLVTGEGVVTTTTMGPSTTSTTDDTTSDEDIFASAGDGPQVNRLLATIVATWAILFP
eukprot:512465_1